MGLHRIRFLHIFLVSIFWNISIAFSQEYETVKDDLELCSSCHGLNGDESIDPSIPILAGQHFYYLYIQLKDLASESRHNEIMSPIAKMLDKDKMKLLSKYFSEKIWPTTTYETKKSALDIGFTATVGGQCVQCHRGGYEGDSQIPRLAGQNKEYLENTMLDFKNKARNNSPAKSSLLKSYSDEEISAMAEYLASM